MFDVIAIGIEQSGVEVTDCFVTGFGVTRQLDVLTVHIKINVLTR